MTEATYDVIVVGAGPGGAGSAYLCARAGLRVLLLERAKLPRDKVCTGLLMCLGISEVQKIFGRLPEEALAEPRDIKGWLIHVPGAGSMPVEHKTYQSWRRNLDYWCTERARQAGSDVRDQAGVRDAFRQDGGYTVLASFPGGEERLRCRYLIGADGAASIIRKRLWPDQYVRYSHAVEKWFPLDKPIDPNWFHCLTYAGMAPLYSNVIVKDGKLVYEFGFRSGAKQSTDDWTAQFVADEFATSLPEQAEHSLGCGTALLYFDYLKGKFKPAKDNVMLIGDAGGLMLPIIGEGIGASFYTGRVAAECIVRTQSDGGAAGERYIEALGKYLDVFLRICKLSKSAQDAAKVSPQAYLEAMAEAVATSFEFAQELVD